MCSDTRKKIKKEHQLLGTEVCKTGKHSSRSKTAKLTGLGQGGSCPIGLSMANRGSQALSHWETSVTAFLGPATQDALISQPVKDKGKGTDKAKL